MYEWNEAIQKMICWIEDRLTDNPSLQEMSAQIGYSPYYCSVKFHEDDTELHCGQAACAGDTGDP